MEILLWLVPPLVVALVAMCWVGWVGRESRGEVDREEALRRLGEAGKRAAAALGPSALTPREREVAVLAARGRTAPQIALELYIGERTVESHLARIYAKLGVDSKLDLMGRAAELGLAE